MAHIYIGTVFQESGNTDSSLGTALPEGEGAEARSRTATESERSESLRGDPGVPGPKNSGSV